MMKNTFIFSAFALLLLSSCEKVLPLNDIFHPGQKDNTFSGADIKMGNGMAHSRITVSPQEVPKVIALEMTDAVLTGLPDTNFTVTVPLHSKAKGTTPFDHIYITWASKGHPLPGTFIGPHMDVRFFMTSLAEHLSIPAYAVAPAGFDSVPPVGYMPASYYRDASIPQLGLHWTNKNYSDPLNETMILGTYNGKFTFISPIVTSIFLKSGQGSSTFYAQPQYFPKTNTYYPTKYNIYMDNTTKNHIITLSDFVLR